MNKIDKQLQDILDIKKIDPKKKISSLKHWDSMVFLQIITLAKNEYKKNINGNDLENLKTLADLIALLKK
jgi:acyl carrier protein